MINITIQCYKQTITRRANFIYIASSIYKKIIKKGEIHILNAAKLFIVTNDVSEVVLIPDLILDSDHNGDINIWTDSLWEQISDQYIRFSKFSNSETLKRKYNILSRKTSLGLTPNEVIEKDIIKSLLEIHKLNKIMNFKDKIIYKGVSNEL